MGYVEKLLEYTKLYESPTSFWKWSAYASIAAVLRDNLSYAQGFKKLYCNVYVLFLAPSGVYRKGLPIEMAEEIVRAVGNTKVVSGRSSIQALVADLSHTETDMKTGVIVKGGSSIFFAPELAASLVNDDQAIPILTNIYDFKANYSDKLISRASKAEKIVFSILMASNKELLSGIYTSAAIGGGLLARTFLVVANEFRPSNSLFNQKDMTAEKKDLVETLRKISCLGGDVTITEDAQKYYNDWYDPFRKGYEKRPDKTGIVGRIHTSILKLSIIIAANDLSKTVTLEHMEKAIHEAISLLPNYNQIIMSSGKSSIKDAASFIIEGILTHTDNRVTSSSILQRYWNEIDSSTLEEAALTLEKAELIKIEVRGNNLTYVGTAKLFSIYQGSPNGRP